MRLMRLTFSRFISGILLTCIVSLFFFPIGFKGLPSTLNSKQILGVIGILFFAFKSFRDHSLVFRKYTVVSFLLAVTFSVWCYFSCVVNTSTDYTYAKYFLSFSVWLGAAYAVTVLIYAIHGEVDISIITKYLIAVAVLQCVSTLLVDNVSSFQSFVDSYIIQDVTPKNVGRKYGLGCSLDSGGIRFCIILILMAHHIVTHKEIVSNKLWMSLYFITYFFIAVIGCMIARTTLVGCILGLGILFVSYGVVWAGTLSRRQLRFFSLFAVIVIIGVAISIYMYNNNPEVRHDLRFAFEAFFNLFETGEFRTDSSDRLNEVMWIWPDNHITWLIGDAQFEHFAHGTDIGYCRFTWYCGLVGLLLFSIFFIYDAAAVYEKFNNARLLSYALLILTFVVWIKVSTDIFQIYALLFCVSADYMIPGIEDDE